MNPLIKTVSRVLIAVITALVVAGCGVDHDAVVGTWSRTSTIRKQDSKEEAGKVVTILSVFSNKTFVSSHRATINGQSPDQGDIKHGTWQFKDRKLILDLANDEPNTELIYDSRAQTLTNDPPSSDAVFFTLQADLHEKHLSAASILRGEWEANDGERKLTFVFNEQNQLNVIEGNKLESFSYHSHFCMPLGMLETIEKDDLIKPERDFYLAEFIGPDRLRIGLRSRDRTIGYISWDYVDKTLILKKTIQQ
jgi:hypothetical protein